MPVAFQWQLKTKVRKKEKLRNESSVTPAAYFLLWNPEQVTKHKASKYNFFFSETTEAGASIENTVYVSQKVKLT